MPKKGGSAPTPPDPAATANAQTQSNTQTAVNNSYLNNVNQNTPWGNVSYDVTGTGPGGIPRWTQTTTLSPNQQTLNDMGESNSIGLAGLAGQGINTASGVLGQNWSQRYFNGNGVTGGALDIAGALGDYNGDVESRYRELATRGLGEQFDRGEESLRSRLAAQGVNAGSDAFGSELQGFNEAKGNAYASAELNARNMALADRQQQVSELLGQRGTNWNEALQQYGLDDQADFNARSRPLNEITSLASGSQLYYQPTSPGQPNQYGIVNTDVAGIYNQGYQNQLAAYQANQASRNGLLGALANLGGAAIAYSDRRLKRDIAHAHTDDNGQRWYRYRYEWDADNAPPRYGVMADEAPAHAVSIDPHSGFAMVDYAAL